MPFPFLPFAHVPLGRVPILTFGSISLFQSRLLSMFGVGPLLARDLLTSTSYPREVHLESVRSKSDVPINALLIPSDS